MLFCFRLIILLVLRVHTIVGSIRWRSWDFYGSRNMISGSRFVANLMDTMDTVG